MGPEEQLLPPKKGHHRRVSSLVVDETQASCLLTEVVKENDVYVGGSSLGKGLKKAARFYFNEHLAAEHLKPSHLQLPGREDLADDVDERELMPLEDSFYVVDIAMVVSQVRFHCWRLRVFGFRFARADMTRSVHLFTPGLPMAPLFPSRRALLCGQVQPRPSHCQDTRHYGLQL
jgi:hypothetical protein